MWQAIRYRGGQSLVLVLISALVTTCAVFAPLFSRAIDQALLRATIGRLEPADLKLGVLASRARAQGDASLQASTVEESMPPALMQWYEPGIAMTTDQSNVVPTAGKKPSPVRLVARDEVCEHLTLDSGTCPSAPDDLLVSAADAKLWGWKVGTPLTVPGAKDAQNDFVVSGTYTVKEDPGYWLRTELQGKSGVIVQYGDLVPGIDDFVVTPEALKKGRDNVQITVDYPLRTDTITLDSLAAAGRAVAAIEPISGAGVTSPLPQIAETVDNGKALVRQLVPLLIAQLVAVALAVLVLVASAAVAQRRPEIAVARLRGRSREGSRRLVMAELGATVLLGLPLGVLLAVALSEIVRRFVLPPGVPFELGWQVPAAAAAAGLASLAVVYAAARPVLREPIASLLRRVPPATASRGLRVTDVVLIVLAAVGIVGLLTNQVTGPMAVLTPTLLALAAGALLGTLAVVGAARLGRRGLARGRLGPALASLAIARRPATRQILLVVTAVSALVVFATNAVAVADRNRQNRAELTAGAFAALRTGSKDPTAVARLVDGLPAGQREHAMPVGIVTQRDAQSTPTLAARPDQLRRIAYAPPAQEGLRLGPLALPDQEPVMLSGKRITAMLVYDTTPRGYAFSPQPPGQGPAKAEVDPKPLRLGMTVTTPDGQVLSRDLTDVPHTGKGTIAVDAPVLCDQGCRLQGLWLQVKQPQSPWGLEAVSGTLDLSGIAVDGTSLGIDGVDGWLKPVPPEESPTSGVVSNSIDPATGLPYSNENPVVSDRLAIAAAPGGGLRLDFENTGRRLGTDRADTPAVVPSVLAGPVPVGGKPDRFAIQNLAGLTTPARATQRVPALPFVGERGALVNLDLMLRVGGTLPASGAMEMWVDEDFPGGVAGAERALRAGGFEILQTRTYADEKRLLDESATGWGLLLGVFAALLALVLAAVMLVVVAMTTGRVVTRDIAALRVAGVSGAELRRAALREALLPVLAAALVGGLCGIAGSWLAMPLIPLFDTPAAVPALDLAPAWLVMALAWLVVIAVLGVVATVLGLRAARRGDSDRLREAW